MLSKHSATSRARPWLPTGRPARLEEHRVAIERPQLVGSSAPTDGGYANLAGTSNECPQELIERW